MGSGFTRNLLGQCGMLCGRHCFHMGGAILPESGNARCVRFLDGCDHAMDCGGFLCCSSHILKCTARLLG